MSSLNNQVILITGASAGIGAALAERLATQYPGVKLAIAARNAERLEALASQCRQAGAEVLVVPTDMEQTDQVTALAETVVKHYGRVNILVNNAGYGQMGPVELIPVDAAKRQFAINLIGPLTLTRCLIPTMRDQGGGRIVNVSSLGGRMAFPFGGLYSSSKFALEGLSDALRMELSPFNIKVSVVEPGPVMTEFFNVANKQVELAIANPKDTPYRAAFENLERLDKQLSDRAWTSVRVADVIIKPLCDRNPRPRYLAATGGGILLFLMTKLMPTFMVDAFWKRFYRIDRVAQDWKSQHKST